MSENEEIIAHSIVIEYSVNKSLKTGKIKNWLHMSSNMKRPEVHVGSFRGTYKSRILPP